MKPKTMWSNSVRNLVKNDFENGVAYKREAYPEAGKF